jgi:formylglycine-generating enzyme required for sulfatase activity
MRITYALGVVWLGLACGAAWGGERAAIGSSDFVSVLAPSPTQKVAHVEAFRLDRRPITNGEFLAFVVAQPTWQRGRVAALFADEGYLSHWASPVALGAEVLPDQPVTRISWFAARAYCTSQGARLPTWVEWELAAAASEDKPDARQDSVWRERILTWYSRPMTESLRRVGQTPPNFYGVQDLHGLIWEWVEDFSALMVSGDSRDQGDPNKLAFCGAGALSAQDRENYPILMRIAYLSAVKARSTTHSLGFRCAEGPSP